MKRGNLVVYGGIMTSKGKDNTGKWGEGTGDPDKAALNFCAPYGNVTATIKGGTITAAGDAVLTDDQPIADRTASIAAMCQSTVLQDIPLRPTLTALTLSPILAMSYWWSMITRPRK